MRKRRREWKQPGHPLQKASLCRRLRAGSPSAKTPAAAFSVAPHAAGDALAAHTMWGAVPANPGSLL